MAIKFLYLFTQQTSKKVNVQLKRISQKDITLNLSGSTNTK
jgi:hypothetical protein